MCPEQIGKRILLSLQFSHFWVLANVEEKSISRFSLAPFGLVVFSLLYLFLLVEKCPSRNCCLVRL